MGVYCHEWFVTNPTASLTALPTWRLSPGLTWLYEVTVTLYGMYAYFTLALFAVLLHDDVASFWFLWALGTSRTDLRAHRYAIDY